MKVLSLVGILVVVFLRIQFVDFIIIDDVLEIFETVGVGAGGLDAPTGSASLHGVMFLPKNY